MLYESCVRYGQEGKTEPDVLGGEILVGGDTVIEQEVIVLKASRNTLMARNTREICDFFIHLYLHIKHEQNKSIAVGPFYMGTYFEPIWTLLPEDVAVLNRTGRRGIGPCNVGTPHVY